MALGGGGEPCTLCSKTVYPAEKLKTSTDNVYHQKCFHCTKVCLASPSNPCLSPTPPPLHASHGLSAQCKRGLQVSTYCEDAVTGRLYCKTHYGQMAKAAGIDAVARGGIPSFTPCAPLPALPDHGGYRVWLGASSATQPGTNGGRLMPLGVRPHALHPHDPAPSCPAPP